MNILKLFHIFSHFGLRGFLLWREEFYFFNHLFYVFYTYHAMNHLSFNFPSEKSNYFMKVNFTIQLIICFFICITLVLK